ncbi:MAG: hypothetical protein ABIQ32_12450 [Sphingomicrobium sp.]
MNARIAEAVKAARLALAGSNLLLRAAESGQPELAEVAVGSLLEATATAIEQAGFHPDETQRGQLYRAILEYIEPRQLGDASDPGARHG